MRKLEFDLLRYLRDEADSDSSFEPDELELSFGGNGGEPVSIGIEGLSLVGRIDRVDTHGSRALVRDYKTGRSRADYGASKWIDENRLQIAVYMLALAEVRPELEVVAGVYDPLAGSKPNPRGLLLEDARDELGDGWTRTDWRDREEFDAILDEAREAVGEVLARMRARRRASVSRLVRLERRLHLPRDLQARGMSAELTPEQQAAVEERGTGLFVHANAGSGKTRVLVERFVRAVVEDGVPVDRILAITFTEKAAAELRARLRARFLELGERDRAREAEGAWVSTIHGFCSRLLRRHALLAGIDPEYEVLDETRAARIAIDAFDRALEDFLDPDEPERLDLAAAHTPDRLRRMVTTVHAKRRSAGEERPGAAGDRGAAAWRRARRARRGARGGARELGAQAGTSEGRRRDLEARALPRRARRRPGGRGRRPGALRRARCEDRPHEGAPGSRDAGGRRGARRLGGGLHGAPRPRRLRAAA